MISWQYFVCMLWAAALVQVDVHAEMIHFWDLNNNTTDQVTGIVGSIGNGPIDFTTTDTSFGAQFTHGEQKYISTGVALGAGDKSMAIRIKQPFTPDTISAGNAAVPGYRFYFGHRPYITPDEPWVGVGDYGESVGPFVSTDPNVFHTFIMTVAGDIVKVYQNGQSIGQITFTGTTETAIGQFFQIGRGGGSGYRYADGLIDSVVLFDHALNTTQINAINSQGLEDYAQAIINGSHPIPAPLAVVIGGVMLGMICRRR